MSKQTTPPEEDDDPGKPHPHLAEVRERIATQEAQTEAMRSDLKQLDEKQDEILDRVRNIDNAGVDPTEFEEVSQEVEQNSRMRYVLQLLGALGVALSSGAAVSLL